MNAINLLNQQHDEVDALFAKIPSATSSSAKEKLFVKIADSLAIHATIEEKIFYPAVLAKRTEDILLESLEEHLGIKRVIADLLKTGPADETFEAKLKVLQEQVEHHVEEEKTDLFPKVKKLFDTPLLEALGQQMETLTLEMEGKNARLMVPGEIQKPASLPSKAA